MNYGPNWILRGGYGLVVVYAVDTAGAGVPGESFATRSVRPLAYAVPEPETRLVATGETVDETKLHAAAADVVGWPEIKRLRRWRAQGYRVRARILAAGQGRHVLWDQAVRVRLRPFSDGRGAFEGDRLLLETARFDAAVTESPDLLALVAPEWDAAGAETAWPGSGAVVLPAPGLRVYAFVPAEATNSASTNASVDIEALNAAGGVLASANTGALASVVLPDGTWSVRVSCSARPVLTTYPVSDPSGGYSGGNA